MMRGKLMFFLLVVALNGNSVFAQEGQDSAGNIDIRSTLVGARVYLGDTYVGDADLFIDNVPPGDHFIILRQGSQRISGQITIKPGETLMLEGRFEEGRIVDLREIAREEAAKRAEAEKKAESEKKAEAEKKKREAATAQAKAEAEKKKLQAEQKKVKPDQKKQVAEAKKPQKSPEEERRELYLNIIRADFDGSALGDVKVSLKANPRTITNLNDSKGSSGKLYHNKQNIMLCEAGSCSRDWTGRFFYTDETDKRDAFLLRWRETVFTGVTPAGTSKFELDWCLNGECKRLTFSPATDTVVQGKMERYVLSWGKGAFTIRRADILKEITDAGGTASEF